MKSACKLLSTLMLCLPLLCVSILWDSLPDQLPVHFNDEGQPDRFAPRQEWLSILLNILVALVLIRTVIISLLSKKFAVQGPRYIALYLLSAAFNGSILGLVVLRTLYRSSVYTDYLPVIMVLFGAAVVYFTIPANSPADDETREVASQPQSATHRMRTLSRLTVVRVNLLAALLMLFARAGDRWAIGFAANLLAVAVLSFLSVMLHRQSS